MVVWCSWSWSGDRRWVFVVLVGDRGWVFMVLVGDRGLVFMVLEW